MKTIAICVNRRLNGQPSCAARGSEALAQALEIATKMHADIRIIRLPCMGACEAGPNVKVAGGDLYHGVDLAMLPLILEEAGVVAVRQEKPNS
ncbi:(2Fe-2S) ferredoxin domain-containing protein [Iodobacter sp. HSC-16F04]|uniref:(2Fe-2S) ferredoxin domain-containing protein n=1 Tax=Iodobacter violaceini TaxID=3044271 RepID=A0ABX0KPS4_9NEIS|nr:(2Fe-2S) ferredoxin domain-containing protein [Iodobacter violacea]NHQ86425.1 (2Fe-2S) ferredoxin domain-containing protein [Iodobacter violacea]